MTVELLDGEEVLVETRPHPVAFADHHVFWIVLAVAGAIGLVASRVTGFGNPGFAVAIALWCLVVGLVQTLGRISFWWIAAALFVAAAAVVPAVLDLLPIERAALVPVVFGLLAEGMLESYRRAHRFFVTNRRLVFTRQFLFLPYNAVDAYYPHITNLVTKQTIFERMVGAGTVIPVMSSGLNLGSEVVGVAGGFLFFSLAGGREKRLPRALPFLCFYSVRSPAEVAKHAATIITSPAGFGSRAEAGSGSHHGGRGEVTVATGSCGRWRARILSALFFVAAAGLVLFVGLSKDGPANRAHGTTGVNGKRAGEAVPAEQTGLAELEGVLQPAGGEATSGEFYLVTGDNRIYLRLRPAVGTGLVGETVIVRVRYVDGGPRFEVESIEAAAQLNRN